MGTMFGFFSYSIIWLYLKYLNIYNGTLVLEPNSSHDSEEDDCCHVHHLVQFENGNKILLNTSVSEHNCL